MMQHKCDIQRNKAFTDVENALKIRQKRTDVYVFQTNVHHRRYKNRIKYTNVHIKYIIVHVF